MKRVLSMFMAAAITSVAALAADNVTAVFTVEPSMHCANCENKIKSNLRFEKGVKKIKTDRKEQCVTVTYDPDKTDVSKLSDGFKKIGYIASPVLTKDDDAQKTEMEQHAPRN